MTMLRQAENRRAIPSSDPGHIAEVQKYRSVRNNQVLGRQAVGNKGDRPEQPTGYIRDGPSGPSVSAAAQQIRVQSNLHSFGTCTLFESTFALLRTFTCYLIE